MDPRTHTFTISRLFDAPRHRVWRAWTEAERLQQWFGAKGYAMTTPDGQKMWASGATSKWSRRRG